MGCGLWGFFGVEGLDTRICWGIRGKNSVLSQVPKSEAPGAPGRGLLGERGGGFWAGRSSSGSFDSALRASLRMTAKETSANTEILAAPE